MFGGYLLEDCPFLARDRKGVDVDRKGGGKELGGGEREESVFRLYCLRKDSTFNRRGKNIVLKNSERENASMLATVQLAFSGLTLSRTQSQAREWCHHNRQVFPPQ